MFNSQSGQVFSEDSIQIEVKDNYLNLRNGLNWFQIENISCILYKK
jgi:hypothetical protein